MEVLNASTNGDAKKEKAYDRICESWYLSDEEDLAEALKQFKADLAKVEKEIKGTK